MKQQKQLLDDYNKMVQYCNDLSDNEIRELIKNDKCPYQSELLLHGAIGMFHCPLCGEMVVGGISHPRKKYI